MVLMGVVVLKERPRRLMIWSVLLALAGTVIVSWNDIQAGSFTGPTLVGNVACLIGGAGASFYNAYSKKLFVDRSPLEVLVYGYIVAAAMCAVISGVFDVTPFYRASEWSWTAWGGMVILGVTNWGLAQLLWMWLLDRLELVQISLLVSVWALGEHVGVYQLGGRRRRASVCVSEFSTTESGGCWPSGLTNWFRKRAHETYRPILVSQ